MSTGKVMVSKTHDQTSISEKKEFWTEVKVMGSDVDNEYVLKSEAIAKIDALGKEINNFFIYAMLLTIICITIIGISVTR